MDNELPAKACLASFFVWLCVGVYETCNKYVLTIGSEKNRTKPVLTILVTD